MKYLFSTSNYQYLLDEILKSQKHFLEGKVERKTFPDGEKYIRVLNSETIENQDVVVFGSTDDSYLLETYNLCSVLLSLRCKSLTICIPFYSYSTMERAVKSGESVTAKNIAVMLSGLKSAPNGNKIVLLDLHATGVEHYFEGNTHPCHVYAKPVVQKAILDLSKGQEFVLASCDTGRAKWIESLAKDMGTPFAFLTKKRLSGSVTEVTGFYSDVDLKNKHVIIFDDMIRSGSSIIEGAKAYISHGARQVSVVATHGVFPKGAVDRILNSGVIHKVAVTNSHPNSQLDNRILVYSISHILSENI